MSITKPGAIYIYYPEGDNETIAHDYSIKPGGLAFHSPDSRLDRLVHAKKLRRVDTDKLSLPAGIHYLDIPHDKWLNGSFNPSITRIETQDSPIQGTIPVPAGMRSALPGSVVESLQAFQGQPIAAPPSHLAEASAPNQQVIPPPRPQPQRLPSVDPVSGAPIMPADMPEPSVADVDPEFFRAQRARPQQEVISPQERRPNRRPEDRRLEGREHSSS